MSKTFLFLRVFLMALPLTTQAFPKQLTNYLDNLRDPDGPQKPIENVEEDPVSPGQFPRGSIVNNVAHGNNDGTMGSPIWGLPDPNAPPQQQEN